jgi:hypothetical protein
MLMAAERDFLLQFFAYEQLPPKLREISQPFGELAESMVAKLPRNPERTVMLRKLLEAKDCAVRCQVAQDNEDRAHFGEMQTAAQPIPLS